MKYIKLFIIWIIAFVLFCNSYVYAEEQCIYVVDAGGSPMTNLNCSMIINTRSYQMLNDSTKFCYDVTSFSEGSYNFYVDCFDGSNNKTVYGDFKIGSKSIATGSAISIPIRGNVLDWFKSDNRRLLFFIIPLFLFSFVGVRLNKFRRKK